MKRNTIDSRSLQQSPNADDSRKNNSLMTKPRFSTFILMGIGVMLSLGAFAQTHHYHPNWSPNGKHILFEVKKGESHEIFVYSLETKQRKPLTDSPGRDAHPFWSPDGSRVVFQSPRASGQPLFVDLYLMNADGSDVQRLTEKSGFSGVPSWSPNGAFIAFQFKPLRQAEDFNTNNWSLYLIKTDGSEEKRLTHMNIDDQVPNWSPDGRRLIFHSNRTGNDELYTMNIDGSEVTQLTFDPSDESSASYSPDGKRIVFKSTKNGSKELYVMDANGKNLQQLTEDYDAYGIPSWSPDGMYIAFHSAKSGNNSLYMVSVNTKEVSRLIQDQ